MTQQEFEKRTGLTPTAEEFTMVHEMYMACATLDKDEFCEEYAKIGRRRLVGELQEAFTAKNNAFNKIFKEYSLYKTSVINKELEMAQFLLGKAAAYDDLDFEHEALRLVSRGTVILIKAKNGYPMSADDLQYIAENLK